MAVADFNFAAPPFAPFSSAAALPLSLPFAVSVFAFVSLPLGGMAEQRSRLEGETLVRKNTTYGGVKSEA